MTDFGPTIGTIAWLDLTVDDAEGLRDFYRDVVGWEPDPVDLGEYEDFNMNIPGTDTAVAGICHARDGNEEFPAQWLIYIVVDDLEESVRRCREAGGEVVVPTRSLGEEGSFCVIRDPAGAVAALYARDVLPD